MEINHKFDFVEGSFDTKDGKLVCATSDKYAETKLCFKANMNVPFAKIRLHTKDLFIDAQETNEDAYKLGNEISKRWNIYNELVSTLTDLIKSIEYPQRASLGRDGHMIAKPNIEKAKEVIKILTNIK